MASFAAPRGRHPRKSNSAVCRNVVRKVPGGGEDGVAVIVLAKKRHHRATCVSGPGVIDDGFEAIAHLDAIFMFVGGEQEKYAAIVLFAADAKLFVKIDGILLDAFAFERVHGHDGHLRAGFLLEFGAEIFEANLRGGFDHASEVGDITRRTNVFDFLRSGGAKKTEQKKKKNH